MMGIQIGRLPPRSYDRRQETEPVNELLSKLDLRSRLRCREDRPSVLGLLLARPVSFDGALEYVATLL